MDASTSAADIIVSKLANQIRIFIQTWPSVMHLLCTCLITCLVRASGGEAEKTKFYSLAVPVEIRLGEKKTWVVDF